MRAVVLILSHATTIKPKYQAMLHVGPVSQTCRIVAIDRDLMRTGDRASVVFEFCQRPYVQISPHLIYSQTAADGALVSSSAWGTSYCSVRAEQKAWA